MSVSITFRLGDKEYTDYLTQGTDLSAAVVLANRLKPYSYAEIPEVTYTEAQQVNLPAAVNPPKTDVGLLVKVLMRESVSKKIYGLHIRAPNLDLLCEADPDGALRVKRSIGTQIAQWYSTFSGLTFTFEHGAYCGSSL
jgi:hypothetical protein